MSKIAIIGIRDLCEFSNFVISEQIEMQTPFGKPVSPLFCGRWHDVDVVFLSRVGVGARPLPPHRVNARANIWALKEFGVKKIISVVTSGGIRPDMQPGNLVIPDQLIDYTYGENFSFFEAWPEQFRQIDFTYPFCEDTRQLLINNSYELGLHISDEGTMGVSQGPRLQTIAEINRMERDGCHLSSMAGMPEAALARELDMYYACVAVIVGRAPGRIGWHGTSLEGIRRAIEDGKSYLDQLLDMTIPQLL